MKVRFYTLLYIEKSETRLLAAKMYSNNERIDLFVKNASILDKSLKNFKLEGVTVLTNSISELESSKERIGYSNLNIKEIDFSLQPPKEIPFYSAHFKIDVYNYFSTLPNYEYSILLDNDIVMLNKLPETFYEVVKQGIPMAYHIKDYIGTEGLKDIRRIDPSIIAYQWCGGEFIAGCSQFYKELYTDILSFADKYFKEINNGLFHIGDEMLTTISIEHLRSKGLYYYDANSLGIIYRYWGNDEPHPLSHYPITFLHLPYDKVWCSKIKVEKFNTSEYFYSKYKPHRYLNIIKRYIKKMLGRI